MLPAIDGIALPGLQVILASLYCTLDSYTAYLGDSAL